MTGRHRGEQQSGLPEQGTRHWVGLYQQKSIISKLWRPEVDIGVHKVSGEDSSWLADGRLLALSLHGLPSVHMQSE